MIHVEEVQCSAEPSVIVVRVNLWQVRLVSIFWIFAFVVSS